MFFHLKLPLRTAVIILFPFSLILSTTRAQNLNANRFQYLSPVPGSKLNSPESNIIIRFGDAFENYKLDNSLIVTGSKSGHHKGNIVLAENNKTLLFQPLQRFADGEIVTVKLENSLKTISNEQVPVLQYSFTISNTNLNKKIKSDPNKYLELLSSEFDISKNEFVINDDKSEKFFNRKTYTVQEDSLPADFPIASVDSINNPTEGSVFYAPFIYPNYLPTYLIITDNYGIPLFYRKMKSATFDFKKLDDSTLTYFDLGTLQYYIMNQSYEIIDSISVKNGYTTDLHEFIRLTNKHSFLLSYDYEKVPMDTVVEGGDTNATVIGIIMQELDENKNVVFQWRSWDHFKITDATYQIPLTAATVDYVHTNAIDIDEDGNILISSRNLDEITKIDRQTGDIIWRLGGKYCKNNQFTFLNDSIGFSHQHDVRRLANGNITVFDNGNLHSPQFSRVAEYQVDEINKIVSLVWEYKNEPQTFAPAMGSARRLYNHNTIIGWGFSPETAVSEIRPDKTISLYLTIPDMYRNYRAFKFDWKTNLFVTHPDNLVFGYVPTGDSLIQSINVINNSEKPIKINGLLNRDSSFTVITPLPIAIDSLDSSTIQIMFKPEDGGNYSDDLYLQWNHKQERVTQIVGLSGTTIVSVKSEGNKMNYVLDQNYPNPFNPVTTIIYEIPKISLVSLKIFDLLGREVATLVNEEKPAGRYKVEFNGDRLSSGLYFYKLQSENYTSVKKMILLK